MRVTMKRKCQTKWQAQSIPASDTSDTSSKRQEAQHKEKYKGKSPGYVCVQAFARCVCVCVCQRKTKDRADGMREKRCPLPSTGFEPVPLVCVCVTAKPESSWPGMSWVGKLQATRRVLVCHGQHPWRRPGDQDQRV